MKKKASIFSISLLVIGGLILAVPFSPLRGSFGTVATKVTKRTLMSLAIGINSPRNVSIASYITNSLDNKPSYDLNNTYLNNRRNYQVSNNESGTINGISTRTNTTGQQLISSDVQYLQNNARRNSLTASATTQPDNRLTLSTPNNPNSTASASIKSNQAIAMSGTSNPSAASSSVRQLAGGAPPPSENEIIGTLPIGDGYIFMLILASFVAVIKTRKLAF